MRVPAHIRFTLAELTAYGLQSAEILARANSAIHLVLREHQTTLPTPEMEAACAIISVEDAGGITVAVFKHPEGKTFARVTSEQTARSALVVTPGGIEVRDLRSEPVVPRREPPHAAPAGEGRFDRGVKAMFDVLKHYQEAGQMRGFGATYITGRPSLDLVAVDGEFSLRELASAFLAAYQPQITISDQVRFGQAKRAMKLLLRKWRDEGNIEHLAGSPAAPAEEWADNIGDIISIEGTIDIDALAKAALSVMKGGEGQ